jgi:hypothetical protein
VGQVGQSFDIDLNHTVVVECSAKTRTDKSQSSLVC